MTPDEAAAEFSDVITANREYARTFALGGLSPLAAHGLAVLTCIDSRIDPLATLGLVAGDAKILRNAGGRTTPDAVRSLIMATHLLAVRRILVMPHTHCAGGSSDDAEIRRSILERNGVDVGDYEFHATPDQQGSLRHDLDVLRREPLLAAGVQVAGAIYDVDTGLLSDLVVL